MENSEVTRLKTQTDPKSPGLAAFLGFCLAWIFLGPVGYLYLGQWNWFWITIAITVVAYPLTGIVFGYVLFPFIFAFHQYQMAKELNAKLEPPQPGQVEPVNDEDGEGNAVSEDPNI